MALDSASTTGIILAAGLIALAFAGWLYKKLSDIKLQFGGPGYTDVDATKADPDNVKKMDQLKEIYGYIQNGAKAFLYAEYRVCAFFIVGFFVVVLVASAHPWADAQWLDGALTAISFLVGALTAILSGYIGMMVAVFGNARCTVSAWLPGGEDNGPKDAKGWKDSFNTAFRAGAVMGFSLTGLALLVCYVLCNIYKSHYGLDGNAPKLFEAISGFGLGGSCIAMFGRVGGGIFTKAADVGADLAGKVYAGFPEDSPRNPATIADNVGDNVGDVAGMGSDLFGSFAEATCAALVVGASSTQLQGDWSALMFPLLVSSMGIFVCLVVSFIATDISPVRKESDVEKVLKIQLFVTALVMTAAVYGIAHAALPDSFTITSPTEKTINANKAFVCVIMGLWSGCAIGFITEYYTSFSYSPVQMISRSGIQGGAAVNIIQGLALGYKSLILPIILLSVTTYVSFYLAGMYGVALAALGMIGTLATCLTIDVYGPVCDNAGGIAEMAELQEFVREKTDALDAAGNTTAAIGKGFAIGSAALVALALFGAFVTRCQTKLTANNALTQNFTQDLSVLSPVVFSWIFMGAMIPYAFTAMTMKSVGTAAAAMVEEVGRQLREIPGLEEGRPGVKPEHDKCIRISTDASLTEMVPPGLLVIFSPILCGTFFGIYAVCGLLTGSITSGVQLAISQSNSGGAWDNAKKYVERGAVKIPKAGAQQMYLDDPCSKHEGEFLVLGKGSELHKAAVVGDTVGDPLKDTSGPAINIVMKLQAIISLVFAEYFLSINDGRGLFKVSSS